MKRAFVACFLLGPGAALFGATPTATSPNLGPPPVRPFWHGEYGPALEILADQGFRDRLNSYAWSMAEFNGMLYVGTGRYVDTFHPMWEAIWGGLAPGELPPALPDTPPVPFLQEWFDRSGGVPKVIDPALYDTWKKKSLAHIWRFPKEGGDPAGWQKVYQAKFVPSFLRDELGQPAAYQASNAMGFRSMTEFTDVRGRTSLFAFVGGFTFARPDQAPLAYRSFNGYSWVSVNTPAAMGRETRASAVHAGKLFVGVGRGPSVWCTSSAAPSAGDWQKAFDLGLKDPTNTGVVSLASFEGRLYVGTENAGGYQIWAGSGDPLVDDWELVVSGGAADQYNAWAATMEEFDGYLYVGSIGLPVLGGSERFKGFDIIRVAPDGSWELVVGGGAPVAPNPGFEYPISASYWPSGFGNPMNFYCWSMEVHDGSLYVGTFDATVFLRYLVLLADPLPPLVQRVMFGLLGSVAGADLWKTEDGLRWCPVSLNGFGNMDNYGFRNLLSFGGDLCIGTANPFWGCEILRIPGAAPEL